MVSAVAAANCGQRLTAVKARHVHVKQQHIRAHTVLELLSSKHSLRVEWYIVILIVLEILLTLYQLFLR